MQPPVPRLVGFVLAVIEDRLARVVLVQLNLFCCPDGFRERPAVGENGETGAVERHRLI